MKDTKKGHLQVAENSGSETVKYRGKDNKFLAQEKEVFQAFSRGTPKSMLQVAFETGVMRSNITWACRKWRLQGKIMRIHTGICPITKMRVGKYSTNPELFPKGGDGNGI